MKIIGIDPGTVNCGMAVIEVINNEYHLVDAFTYSPNKAHPAIPLLHHCHSKRFARCQLITERLWDMMALHSPALVACESSYYSRFEGVNSFKSLTEIRSMLELTVYNQNPNVRYLEVAPSTAKKAVGVSKQSGDKDLTKEGLLRMKPFTTIAPHIGEIDDLGPDAIDAVAIGIAALNRGW